MGFLVEGKCLVAFEKRRRLFAQRTMVQNNQESRRKHWAIRSSVHSFTHTTHSFACSALLALLTHSAAPIHSLAYSLTPGKMVDCMSQNDLILSHSAAVAPRERDY